MEAHLVEEDAAAARGLYLHYISPISPYISPISPISRLYLHLVEEDDAAARGGRARVRPVALVACSGVEAGAKLRGRA